MPSGCYKKGNLPLQCCLASTSFFRSITRPSPSHKGGGRTPVPGLSTLLFLIHTVCLSGFVLDSHSFGRLQKLPRKVLRPSSIVHPKPHETAVCTSQLHFKSSTTQNHVLRHFDPTASRDNLAYKSVHLKALVAANRLFHSQARRSRITSVHYIDWGFRYLVERTSRPTGLGVLQHVKRYFFRILIFQEVQ